MTVQELRDQRGSLHASATEIINTAEAESRTLTADEQNKVDRIFADIDELGGRIATEERKSYAAEIRAELEQSFRKTRPTMPAARAGEFDRDKAFRDWALYGTRYQNTDNLSLDNAKRAGFDLGSRSVSLALERRDMTKGGSNVGAQLAPQLFPTEFDRWLKYYSPIRESVRVYQTTTGNTIPWPTVNDTANSAELTAEAASFAADQDVATSSVSIGAYKIDSRVQKISIELLRDGLNVESIIAECLMERLGRKVESYIVAGTGSSQPKGLKTAVGGTGGTYSLASPSSDVIIDLFHSVDLAYRNDSTFIVSDTFLSAIRKLKATTGNYIWQPGLQDGQPDRILGRPYIVSNVLDAGDTATHVPMLFGALSKYIWREVQPGIEVFRFSEKYMDAGEVGFVAYMRADGNFVGPTTALKKLVVAA